MIFDQKDLQSDFVAFLSLKNNEKVNDELVMPLVERFFNFKNVSDFKEIDKNSYISDEDLKYENFSGFFEYFYKHVVFDIHKNITDVDVIVKYCITFDKKTCSKKCKGTGVLYDEIVLYEKPVFYFIYISIDDIFSFLRKSNF